MQVPLLSGIGTNEAAEFVASYPLNLEPHVIDSKVSKGQLRFAAGAVPFATGPGIDRGGINWNGTHLRVMGTSLVRVNADATVDTLGDVGGSGSVSMDYSFDRLGIRSGTSLFYWDGATLSQVTDTDLGQIVDLLWIDGFFMATDGTYVVVTELSDPTSVTPLKYGSAEVDPDPITGLIKVKQNDEAYVLGRYTIQIFQNVGGNGFPFQTVKGGTIPFGCVSASAKCQFGTSFAFVGSARDEALGVRIASDGDAPKISTREVDDALAAVEDPTAIVLERRAYRDEVRLFVHLPTESWVFLAEASKKAQEPVWHRAQSGHGKPYRLRNAVLVDSSWYVGDTETAAVGRLTKTLSTHFGEAAEWQFDAGLLYNQAKGAIVDSVELVGIPGRGGVDATTFLSFTRDGEIFDTERPLTVKAGDRRARLQWRPGTKMENYMGLRFRGFDSGLSGFAACEVAARPLSA